MTVNVYDDMGMMVGSAELCLAEHQFGAVSLQGPSGMMANGYQMQTVSMMDDEIPAYGWVKVIAETQKLSSCDGGTRTNPRVNIDTDAETEQIQTPSTRTQVAAWTIIQDVGMGFFGTEVPTSTVSLASVPGLDATDDLPALAEGDPMMACYGDATSTPTNPVRDGDGDITTAGVAANRSGDFNMSRCGLIPERHNNNAFTLTNDVATAVDDAMTPRAHALARYDAMDESMIVVWLADGADDDMTHPSDSRTLDVVVKCEDGMVIDTMPDAYGDPVPLTTSAPNKLTMIDPTMGAVGDATAMCASYRGAVRITMPDGSHAGAVFSHITQMGGHYRMNFPGYSMASNIACEAAADADTDAQEVALCMAR